MDKRDISQMEEKPGGSAEKRVALRHQNAYLCIPIEEERFNVIDKRGRNKSFFFGGKTLAPRFPNQKCVVVFLNHLFFGSISFFCHAFLGVCVCGAVFGRWLCFGCGW